MKTKEELLQKYEGNKRYYNIIKAHYGSKDSFQDDDGSILDFDENSMKDIVGAEKITYPEYIDIQIQTGNNFRGSLMLCYHEVPCEFKGEVEKVGKRHICFKRLYTEYMNTWGEMFEGKEDHVWMSKDGFDDVKVKDCYSFYATVYRYIKQHDTRLDYGLKNPENVKK